ncbi:hypothetical protein DL765_004026 [Monosporascus sp. GIB2]|nr:hypothetical protein DL765_004026 [Monosporascus sp. GIB2]
MPPSSNTVKVSIIDSTTQMTGIPAASFFEPAISGFEKFSGCSYSFLIEHEPTGDKLLFDLGSRKDIENHAAAALQMLEAAKGTPLTLKVEKNVSDTLEESDVELGASTDIIWWHRHLDNTGTRPPSRPPPTSSPEPASGTPRATRAGGWHAVDRFGDGSFCVLHSPGHTNEHLRGLARTELAAHSSLPGKDEFALMAGDVCHHGG